MTSKRVIPREAANRDVDEAVDYYLTEGGEKAAIGFIDDVERAYRRIAGNLATGSTRCAHELDLPGLKSRPLKRYPLLTFYVEHDDHVDVWRILHGERDIPAWMREP